MTSKKWLNYTLIVLFTLVALTVVGVAGFRIGVMQGASFSGFKARVEHRPQFSGNLPNTTGEANGFDHNFQQGFDSKRRHEGFAQGGFDPRGFDRENGRGFRGRGGFFSPLFGLIHLVLLAGLLWLAYKLIKNSGWRLVKVNATPMAETPVEAPAPVEEKKPRRAKRVE